MRVFVSLLLALIALPSGAHPLTVDEIVNRYVEARGCAAKLDALRSLRLTGKAVFGFGDAQIIFLDPDYFLEIRVETVSRIRGAERITEMDLGSYEQVEGVWIPFSIESGRMGRPRQARFTVERAEANVEAEDSLFVFPL